MRTGLCLTVAAARGMRIARMLTGTGIAPFADVPDGECRDGLPELVIRRTHPAVAMPVLARRRDEIGEPVEELLQARISSRGSAVLQPSSMARMECSPVKFCLKNRQVWVSGYSRGSHPFTELRLLPLASIAPGQILEFLDDGLVNARGLQNDKFLCGLVDSQRPRPSHRVPRFYGDVFANPIFDGLCRKSAQNAGNVVRLQ